MAKSQPRRGIPTKLSKEQFEQFILPHLSKGSRGPATTLSFHAIFNYILCVLYLGCQWKNLPIERDRHGHREIHPTSILDSGWLSGCHTARFGMQTARGSTSRYVCRSRRRHDYSGEKGR